MQPIGDRLPGSEFASLASQAQANALASTATRASAQAASAARDGRSVKSAAKDFEALFATMLVKEMRKALPEGFFGGETEGDVYGGWFDEQLGRKIAEGGALHLADTLEASFVKRAPPSADASGSDSFAPALHDDLNMTQTRETQRAENATSEPEAQQ